MQCKFGIWWWTSVTTSPTKFGGGGALKWTSVSTSPAKFGGGGSDTFSQVSRAVTLAIHRPDGFAAGKKWRVYLSLLRAALPPQRHIGLVKLKTSRNTNFSCTALSRCSLRFLPRPQNFSRITSPRPQSGGKDSCKSRCGCLLFCGIPEFFNVNDS